MLDQFNFAMLILRLAAGLMIIAHGYNHIWGGGKIKGTAGWFGSMGMKPPLIQAWLASVTELGAGAMLCVGLLTPLAAGSLLGIMAVAFWIEHRKRGFFIFKPGQGWEYVAFIGVVSVVLGTLGAGEWSLDNAFDITLFEEWKGLITVLVVGLGGSALLLATSYRPVKK